MIKNFRNLLKIHRRVIYRQLIGAGPWCGIDRSPSYHAERRGGDGRIDKVAYNSIKRTVALHDLEELDNDLGAGSDQDLALAGLLGIVDAVEGVVENGSADHFGGIEWRFSSRDWEMRYLPMDNAC